MKDRIEISKVFDEKGNEIIKFCLHCDLGVLWMFNKPFSISVYNFFCDNRSVSELHSYRYTNNKKLNKIVDRLPAHIKYVKQLAVEEKQYDVEKDRTVIDRGHDYEIAA